MSVNKYVRLARTIMDTLGLTAEEAVRNEAIPPEFKELVRAELESEVFEVRDLNFVEDRARDHQVWLPSADRNQWYYWPRLRSYLIDKKGRSISTARSIDDATDKILGKMENPLRHEFDTRALVVGYVQSGKTANYTALIAKAVDTGYKLVIVLTGMQNTLRYQTQVRLDNELVGVLNNASVGVGRPSPDKEWNTFTMAHPTSGDFEPGNVNATALSSSNPVLIVTKKNGPVLRKLIGWLERTQEQTRRNLPCLIIDDEADQASINTGGNRPPEADWDDILETADNQDSPSTINGLIRHLLDLFTRKAYIAYTATPFANVLINHEARDSEAGGDLYPNSFITALPRPDGYYGAREIFGTADGEFPAMDVLRRVEITEIPMLVPARRDEVDDFEPSIPKSLDKALKDYILAGAARIARGNGEEPTAMLVHTSYRTSIQVKMAKLLREKFGFYRDEWRYMRNDDEGLAKELRKTWEGDFTRVTRTIDVQLDMSFEEIQEFIGTFLEQVTFKELHGQSEDEIDYENDPQQKIIVIGGNRLSRGLTLEGLLVSYYVRPTPYYDTLMQMGRWFGYREGYVDLTRIYTTKSLEDCFKRLARVEEDLHGDMAKYEFEKLTPMEVGVRIREDPSMLVTSPLKSQHSQLINISLANQTLQTITFQLGDYDWLKSNLMATREFLSALGAPTMIEKTSMPVWSSVESHHIKEFFKQYKTDKNATTVRAEQLRDYIEKQNKYNELTTWVVAVIGRQNYKDQLKTIDLNIEGIKEINLINRSKLTNVMSLKAIASAADQQIGLNDVQLAEAKAIQQKLNIKLAESQRYVRPPQEGLLLIYPISKYSTARDDDSENEENGREALFSDPESAEHVIGIAVVFPHSKTAATVQYRVGTVGIFNS
ncbi:Z1 domain-containing protein [Paenibacillus sp. FSL K6-2393]|uniref:Z1 domain-containing protein n=1 Tax=Paenibacillus sp. FSL K6-2393 TaxID=2921475 RepID=UPI0030FB8C3A